MSIYLVYPISNFYKRITNFLYLQLVEVAIFNTFTISMLFVTLFHPIPYDLSYPNSHDTLLNLRLSLAFLSSKTLSVFFSSFEKKKIILDRFQVATRLHLSMPISSVFHVLHPSFHSGAQKWIRHGLCLHRDHSWEGERNIWKKRAQSNVLLSTIYTLQSFSSI